jgi:hypothetical protein
LWRGNGVDEKKQSKCGKRFIGCWWKRGSILSEGMDILMDAILNTKSPKGMPLAYISCYYGQNTD